MPPNQKSGHPCNSTNAMHPDHQFIEALRQNDPRGIRKIYDQFAGQALRWVVNNNGSAADAQDVFQEALIVLFEKASDPGFVLTCPLGALLHLIYSRKWIDRIRAKNKETGVRKEEETRYNLESDSDVLVMAEEVLDHAAKQERMAGAFAQLSDLCRQLLSMLSEGLEPRVAAEQLQMNSVDTLYRRKNACTQRWRALFAETA